MNQDIMVKCWNGHFNKSAPDSSSYDYCNDCGAIVVKRWVRRDPTKSIGVEMFFI